MPLYVSTISCDEMRTAQREDKAIGKVIKLMESGTEMKGRANAT